MKKFLTKKTIITLFITILIGCFAKRADITSRLPNIKLIFKHHDHNKIIDEEKVLCIYCHPQHRGDDKKGLCHKCHKNMNAVVRAPQNCTLCHEDLNSIKPKDHTSRWKQNHASVAKIDSASCTSCHRDNFCSSCHTKRNDVGKASHTRNYIFYHSVEVRANPYKCKACHVSSFCTDCHNSRGVYK